jgi:septal ring factor EnvC (AmiA/AmiB activator)
MRQPLKYGLSTHWLLLAAALWVASPALSQNQNQNQNNTGRQSQQELESVATAIEDIRGWLNTATQAMSAEESSLRQADSDLAELSNRTDETRINMQQAQTELDALAGEAKSLDLLKAEQAAILNQLIKAAYMRSGPNLLKRFFSQDGQNAISDSARMLHYTLKFSEAQLQKVSEFETLIRRIKSTEIAAAAKVTELEQQSTTLNNQLAAVDLARLEKKNALVSLRSSIASKGQELEQLEINQADLQRLVEEIRIVMKGVRSFADVPPFAGTRGRLEEG